MYAIPLRPFRFRPPVFSCPMSPTLLLRRLKRRSTPWVVLGTFLAFLGLYGLLNVPVLPFSIPAFQAAAEGKTILNVLPYYDAATAYEHLAAYSAEATRIYYAILGFDVVLLIPAYVLFLTTGLLHAGTRLLSGRSPRLLATIAGLPLLAGGLNLFEDALVVVLLTTFPEELPMLAAACGVLTTTKSLLIVTSLLLVAGGYLAIGTSRLTYALGLRSCFV